MSSPTPSDSAGEPVVAAVLVAPESSPTSETLEVAPAKVAVDTTTTTTAISAAMEQVASVASARIVEKVEIATMTDSLLLIEKYDESESAAPVPSSKATQVTIQEVEKESGSAAEMPQQQQQPLLVLEVQGKPADDIVTESETVVIKENVQELRLLELDEAVDAEEPDTLSPLMTDNHTYLQHQEIIREEGESSPQHHYHHHHHHHGHDEIHDYDLDDEEEEDDDDLHLDDDDHVPVASMKHSDTKDSISSIDSDVSLSYDRRSSTESQHPAEDAGAGSSDDNAKDSGCEITKKLDENAPNEDEAFEIPDDDMCEKIIEQVEFYFSNDSILKDAFLLKHVRRNKEGFVSLKLVSSFKRVRQLTKDWRVVGYAIKRKSCKIELNDLGTKIRRVDPLPLYDETTPSRTVVATGLPCDKYTVEKVSELFSKCGEISLIRILRPGGPIPADVRQFINKHPELQQNECALIEFTESASARRAQNMEEFIVLELVAPKKKTGKKANVTKFVENYKFVAGHDIERSRGGETFDRYKMRRGSSGFYPKPEMHHVYQQMVAQPPLPQDQPTMQQIVPLQPHQQPQLQQQHQPLQPMFIPHSPQQRKYSCGNENFDYFNRRPSTFSMGSNDPTRKYSNCSDGYSSCGEMSRRTSQCSSVADSMSRRASNCSEVPSRRSSNCSEFCSCSRRISQCSDVYRRMSQCSEHNNVRKFSVGSNYERKFTNSPEMGMTPQRRISMESNFERKFSTGSMGFESPNISPRKYSNGFDPLRKLSSNSEYYNGRRISTDSGYDRRISIDSACSTTEGPRSRSGSAVQMQCHQHGQGAEAVVRTPIGPDGSRGFGSRTRRVGQIVPPA
ncbi:uncharacterized protein LOC129750904 [Uranotaenia lowii]|uniref:uncharacterized protein LOC129750904 n=1 Tax=Uranotaenia lowii TaxID=190385 RepID=UPI00247AD4FB|nr:uncharacterized protein LOC129750904 [Uranotaenia lowii]